MRFLWIFVHRITGTVSPSGYNYANFCPFSWWRKWNRGFTRNIQHANGLQASESVILILRVFVARCQVFWGPPQKTAHQQIKNSGALHHWSTPFVKTQNTNMQKLKKLIVSDKKYPISSVFFTNNAYICIGNNQGIAITALNYELRTWENTNLALRYWWHCWRFRWHSSCHEKWG